MKFTTPTGQVHEGRPIKAESPSCMIFSIFDDHGREFSYIYKLAKQKYSEGELDAVLESLVAAFKPWAAKKLLDYNEVLNTPTMSKSKKPGKGKAGSKITMHAKLARGRSLKK